MGKAGTIAIIGAGPVGLAAAAHALERGLKPIVLERGATAGHAVRHWAHVPMFSPWAFNIDAAARAPALDDRLEPSGARRLSDRRRPRQPISASRWPSAQRCAIRSFSTRR